MRRHERAVKAFVSMGSVAPWANAVGAPKTTSAQAFLSADERAKV
jgi:hypothetical protein